MLKYFLIILLSLILLIYYFPVSSSLTMIHASQTMNSINASDKYMFLIGTAGEFVGYGCAVPPSPYEDGAMSNTRHYFHKDFISGLISQSKSVEVHDVYNMIHNHKYDLGWLINKLYNYFENPPPKGVLVVFGRHADPKNYVMFQFKYLTYTLPGDPFPPNWARQTSVNILASTIGNKVRNKPLDQLPSLVVLYDCHIGGTIENGKPKPANYTGSWIWAYKFDNPAYWTGRGFIGWLTIMKISPFYIPEDIRSVTEAVKNAISEGHSVYETLNEYLMEKKVPLNLYYKYIRDGKIYEGTVSYGDCNSNSCPWIIYLGDYNVYIDPTQNEKLISNALAYLKIHYPELYGLAVKEDVKVFINHLYTLKIAPDKTIDSYLITWSKPRVYGIDVKIYTDNVSYIFGGMSLLIDEIRNTEQYNLVSNLINKVSMEYTRSINELKSMGFKVIINSSDNHTDSVDVHSIILINNTPLGALRREGDKYLDTDVFMNHLSYIEPEYGGPGVVSFGTDYLLLKYLMSQLVNSNPLHPRYTIRDALKGIIREFEARGVNISIGNAKKYIKLEYVIWDKSIIPVYRISIETSNGYEYRFLINGLTNNIISYVVLVTAGNSIVNNTNTINTNTMSNNNANTTSSKNNKILKEYKENTSHKQSDTVIMILAIMISAIIGIAITAWLYISKRK